MTMTHLRTIAALALLPGITLGCSEEPAGSSATTGSVTIEESQPVVAEAEAVDVPVVAEIDWRSAPSADGRYFIRWRPLVEPIPMADPFDVEVELFTDDSMVDQPGYDSILVDAGMPHHGHGMNVRPELEQRPDGSWVARGMLMHMPGRWQVYIDVLDDGRLERAQWSMWLSG
jgi:hypothetical protein